MDNYSFLVPQVGNIKIEALTEQYCHNHCEELLQLINIIPFINWGKTELLSQEEDYYKNKWNYSYVIKNDIEEIIGVVIAYFRVSDDKHIFDSLYIHKFAINPQYQKKGIGTVVINYFIQKAFREIPWLLNITVQTNINKSNEFVVRFYNNVGFKNMYNIKYTNKTDVLLLLERENYIGSTIRNNIEIKKINLPHPRFNVYFDENNKDSILPIIYFSSSNTKKKEIVKFIFHNYNIDINFTTPPVELTEPQIEKPGIEEERKLVSLPLKTVSRFINTVPYIIEDTMLFVEFFNRNNSEWELPGLDTKRWLRQMGLDGFLEIMGNTSKRKARFVSQTGAYLRANSYIYGRGELMGEIAYKKSEIIIPKYGTYPYFFHLIFIPDGANKTLAEMDMYEYSKYDYMRKSIIELIKGFSASDIKISRNLTLFDYLI